MKGRSLRVDDERYSTAEAFARVWNVSVSEVFRRGIDALEMSALDAPIEPTDQCPQSVQFPHRLVLAEDDPKDGDTVMCIANPGAFCGATFTWHLSDLVTEEKRRAEGEK